MSGTLWLVPTPIDDDGELDPHSFTLLQKAALDHSEKSVFAIEDLKPGRRRWLRWKLPRECVENFILYNEHSKSEAVDELLRELKSGKDVYLMSDGGMPAFCDPGLDLVDRCYESNIRVDTLPFYNSVILAVALSGFDHRSFIFEGFLPREKEQRENYLESLYKQPKSVVLMDTPYRLTKLLEELAQFGKKGERRLFVGCDLTTPQQELFRGSAKQILKGLGERKKREFVLVIEALRKL